MAQTISRFFFAAEGLEWGQQWIGAQTVSKLMTGGLVFKPSNSILRQDVL
jgi:hypothetical protein